jgi:hypothetical protein
MTGGDYRRQVRPTQRHAGSIPKFKNLNLDRDSLLKFANKYGWIDPCGVVQWHADDSIPAIGLGRWTEQIHLMTIADRLLSWARNKDQRALSKVFHWDADRFDVSFRVEMDGKKMVALKPSARGNANRREYRFGWVIGQNFPPEMRPEVPTLGWSRNDLTRPAFLIVAKIVNHQLEKFCRGCSFANSRSASSGCKVRDLRT